MIALIFLRFSRSKEFGTDLPVICLLFIIQIYILNFIKKPNTELIVKSCILFIFAVFLKIYAALAIFYSLFLFNKKNIKEHLVILKAEKKGEPKHLHFKYESNNKFFADIYLTLIFDKKFPLTGPVKSG